ncbi:hypothetical protein JCM18750_30350 [Halostagnicola bangensis]
MFSSGQAIVDRGTLGEDTGPFANLLWGLLYVVAKHAQFSTGRSGEPEQEVNERRFSRAVRPEKSEDLSARYRQRNGLEGDDITVPFRCTLELDSGCFR